MHFLRGVYKLLRFYEIDAGSINSVHQDVKVLWNSVLLARIKQYLERKRAVKLWIRM
jgi:hypothetical protein